MQTGAAAIGEGPAALGVDVIFPLRASAGHAIVGKKIHKKGDRYKHDMTSGRGGMCERNGLQEST